METAVAISSSEAPPDTKRVAELVRALGRIPIQYHEELELRGTQRYTEASRDLVRLSYGSERKHWFREIELKRRERNVYDVY